MQSGNTYTNSNTNNFYQQSFYYDTDFIPNGLLPAHLYVGVGNQNGRMPPGIQVNAPGVPAANPNGQPPAPGVQYAPPPQYANPHVLGLVNQQQPQNNGGMIPHYQLNVYPVAIITLPPFVPIRERKPPTISNAKNVDQLLDEILKNDILIEGATILPKNVPYNNADADMVAVTDRIIVNKTKLAQLLLVTQSEMTFQRSTQYRFKYMLTQILTNAKRCLILGLVLPVYRDICIQQFQAMVEAYLVPIYERESEDTDDGLPIFFVRLLFVIEIPDSNHEYHLNNTDTVTDNENCILLNCLYRTHLAYELERCKSQVKWPRPRNVDLEDLFYTKQKVLSMNGYHCCGRCCYEKGSALKNTSVNRYITHDRWRKDRNACRAEMLRLSFACPKKRSH